MHGRGVGCTLACLSRLWMHLARPVQACEIIASDISAAIGAAKVVLEAVTVDSADARAALKARLEDLPSQVTSALGGPSSLTPSRSGREVPILSP